jgi:hypothetical protein
MMAEKGFKGVSHNAFEGKKLVVQGIICCFQLRLVDDDLGDITAS